MSIASQSMYSAIKDTYEMNWTGYSDVLSAIDVCWSMISIWFGLIAVFWRVW